MPNHDIALRERDAKLPPNQNDAAAREAIKRESAESYRKWIKQVIGSRDSEINTALRKHG